MLRFDRRAGSWSLFFVLTAVSASASGKTVPGAGVPKQLPNAPSVKLEPSPTAPAAAPEVKGWPHSILTGIGTNCARDPQANEVIVFRDPNFTGACAILLPGFYPFADNLLVGDDKITSMKVGSNVRARAFKDPVYSGVWNPFPPGTRSAGLGGFNDTISSMRVEPADRSMTCDDLREGEFALFHHPNGQGDCVVLPGEGSYANPEQMGIQNDTISSIHNNSARTVRPFWHPNFQTQSYESVAPHSNTEALRADGWNTDAIDDDISSIQMVQ